MANNKVVYGDSVLIDLTQDTATKADVRIGKTFHSKDGSIQTGELSNFEVILHFDTLTISGTPTELSEYEPWDKLNLYHYYLDLPVEGVVGSTDEVRIGAIDNDCTTIANVQNTIDDAIRFYFKDTTEINATIYNVNIARIV